MSITFSTPKTQPFSPVEILGSGLSAVDSSKHTINLQAIPCCLKKLPNWVQWNYEPNGKGKLTKIPCVAGGLNKASSNTPATWRTFDEAVKSLTPAIGLGLMLPLSGEMFFVDLDHVRNPQTGGIEPWAERLIEKLETYTEISPSGTGTHILGYVKSAVPTTGLKKDAIELYTKGRYTTITGNHLPSTPTELKTVDVSWLYRLTKADVFTFPEGNPFTLLFNNVGAAWKDLGYPSQSEADMALCSSLAKKLSDNVLDIDCAFRLSGLMSDKWDSKRKDSTYGHETILKVIEQDASPHRDTDIGNAERLVARHGKDIRFSYTLNKWLLWDGKQFAIDAGGGIEQKARETVFSIAKEAANMQPVQRRELLKWAKESHSRGRLSAMVELAKSEPKIPVSPDLLDASPWLFNCDNGTVDLQTGILREHRRGDLLTKLAPVAFDPNATCPLWEKFLARIMDGNSGLINFLQKAVGYSLTGSTTEQVLFIEYGSGRNGKTTFLETINKLFGDYARTADANLLLIKRSEGPRNDIARLEGARLVLTSETPAGGKLDEALVKLLTGEDKIASRPLYHEVREFYSTSKIWLCTNKKPQIRGCDVAIWKRIRLVPFNVTIPDDEQDKKLGQKLSAELPGILAWAVRGCLEWQAKGLGAPPEVIDATKEYENESDVLKEFLDDCCLVDKENKALTVRCTDIYDSYQSYSKENGEKEKDIFALNYFGKLLSERGFGQAKINGKRCRIGIELRPEAAPGLKQTPWTGEGSSAVPSVIPPHSEGFAGKL